MKRKNSFLVGILSGFALMSCQSAFGENTPAVKFHEVARWHLGGSGGWDYLTTDSEARRLYVARDNRVMVVDLDSGKLVSEVGGVEGAHGITILPGTNSGFATAGRAGVVVVFDLKSLKKLSEIKVGKNPDAILYDVFSSRIFVFNGKSKSISVIDSTSKKVIATIAVPGKPEFAVTDKKGHVYVNIEDLSRLLIIDSKNLKVVGEVPLAPCEEPTGLSINPTSNRLYIGCKNKMAVVVDATSGKFLKSVPAGEGIDATAFDEKLNLDFISAGEGLLTVIKDGPTSIEGIQDLRTEKGARTLAIDSKENHIILATALFGPEKNEHPSLIPDSFYLMVLGQ